MNTDKELIRQLWLQQGEKPRHVIAELSVLIRVHLWLGSFDDFGEFL